ncbi:hypothetical protein ScPMuIL_006362 [Solemya velum]
MAQRIRINVGGTLFITQQETLTSYPNTRLARMNTKMTEYDATDGTYYFDRDPECFASILSMYRHRELHFPKYVCAMKMRNEMQFWGIPQSYMSRCCWKTFYEVDEDIDILDKLAVSSDGKASDVESKNFKERVWVFLDDPSSSQAAKIWHCFYLLVVFVSCLVLCLETVEKFRVKPFIRHVSSNCAQHMPTTHRKVAIKMASSYCLDASPAILYTEAACVVFFTVELLCGLVICPSKKIFFKNFLNAVAVIATVAMWCCLIFEFNKEILASSNRMVYLHAALKFASVLRVLLFFRLAGIFNSLQVLLQALKTSARELLLLFVCVVIATMVFGVIMYYIEFPSESSMNNMFISMWWAVITLTTVGYGDVVPSTILGRLVASVCSVLGLLLLALPVAIVVSNFAEYHRRSKDKQRHLLATCGLRQKYMPRNNIGTILK